MAAGDQRAFSRLFYAYHNKLYSFIYTISRSKHFAEDTVQEVFLKIWEKRSEAVNIIQFDSYLFRMARNHTINAFKRSSKHSNIVDDLGELADDSPEMVNELEFKE